MKRLLAAFAVFLTLTAMSNLYAAGDVETGKLKAQTCMGCHGAPGLRNAYPGYRVPKLGGQHANYIVAALRAYQTGERAHPTMQAQAADLTEEDMENIAAYFASLGNPQPNNSVSYDKAAQCTACHGPDGVAPVATNAPVIAGQYSDYIARALLDYQSSERKNPIMAGFAAGLTKNDIKELSQYYSQQTGLAAPDIAE